MTLRTLLAKGCVVFGLLLLARGRAAAGEPGLSYEQNQTRKQEPSLPPRTQPSEPPAHPTLAPAALPQPSSSKPLWPAVVIGSTEAEGGALGAGQIAVRGSLIAVASRGAPNKNDALDGVHILDGRNALRQVRLLPSPVRDPKLEGASDAVGVALDGDFVVFGTYGGTLAKVRLDGVEAWLFDDFPSDARPGLPALFDVNADGVRDAVVPVIPRKACADEKSCGPAWDVLALVVDGKSGHLLRKLEQKPPSGRFDCANRIVSYDAKTASIAIGCVDAENAARANTFALDASNPAQGAAATPQLRSVKIDGLTDNRAWTTLESEGRTLLVSGPSGESVVWRTLDAPLQSPPSIGDVDLDGSWDVLVVAGGMLHVFATGARSDAEVPLWRGDSAASGAVPLVDSPAAYASRVEPRDLVRWLKSERAPDDHAFEPAANDEIDWETIEFTHEAVELPREPKQAVIGAGVQCGSHYGLSEGGLVVEHAARWERVPGAPWPVVALGCDHDLLLGMASGRYFRLPPPLPWRLDCVLGLLLVACAAAFSGWYTTRPSGLPAFDTPEQRAARRVVVSDAPRTQRSEAHPSQDRLLFGLLNVLDNNDTRPPVTLALYGPWGSGKSSIMQMLRSELKQTGRYIDVWFNAWRFQREHDLAPALLQSIVDEVGRQTDWVTRVAVLWHRVRRASARDIALFLLTPALLGLLLAACVRYATSTSTVGVGGKLGALASVAVLFFGGAHRLLSPLFKVFSLDPAKLLASDDSKRRIQFVREFASEFEQISTRLPRGTRLVIFIDDLDRCAPDRIVDVLETLSMLADTGCGFFVLAIDPTTVRRAIELKYRDLLNVAREENPEEVRAFGLRYLEKMITLGVKVPLLAAEETEPDTRLDPVLARPRFFAWLTEHVLPAPPLLIAIALIGVASFWASRNLELVNGVLDTMAHFALEITPKSEEQTQANGLKAAGAATGAQGTTPAEAPGHVEAAAASVAKPSSIRAAAAPPKPQKPRASVLSPLPPPPRVELEAHDAPSAAIELSQVLVAVGMGLCGSMLLGIAALVALDWRRRKRILAARPIGSDSPEFASALKACKKGLPANPRNVVRFTNTSRFLYQVVAQETDVPVEQWEPEFFAALHARWSGAEAGAVAPWLKLALDRWLPDEGARVPPRDPPA